MKRRDFKKLTGAAVVSAALAAVDRPARAGEKNADKKTTIDTQNIPSADFQVP